MKKFSIFLIGLLALASLVPAQWINMRDIRVATIEVVSRVPGESIDTAMLTEMFQVALVDRNAFNLVERALVDKILSEQEFQASGLTDSQIARIGAMAGANKILALTLSRLGSEYILIVKSVDTSSGIVDLSDQVQCSALVDFIELMPVLADRFIRKARGEQVAAYRSTSVGDRTQAPVTPPAPRISAPVTSPGESQPPKSVAADGTPRNGLVSEWLFDGQVVDSAKRRMSRIIDVKLGPDRFGRPDRAGYFNGKTSAIDIGPLFHDPVAAFSVALWFKTDGFNKPPQGSNFMRSVLVSNWNGWDDFNQKGFELSIPRNHESSDSGFAMALCDGKAVNENWVLVKKMADFDSQFTGRWVFVCMVVDNGMTTLYIDDSLAGRRETFKTMVPDLNTPLWIGHSGLDHDMNAKPINWFPGAIDDVRIYNRALDESDVLALFDAAAVPPVQAVSVSSEIPRNGLISEWLFNGDIKDSVRRRMSKVIDVELVEDRMGRANQAGWFNGQTSGMDLGSVLNSSMKELTVALWFKPGKSKLPPSGINFYIAPFISNWNNWQDKRQKGFQFGIARNHDPIHDAIGGYTSLDVTVCDGTDAISAGFWGGSMREFDSKYIGRWMFACMVVKDGFMTVYLDGGLAGRVPTARMMVPDLDSPLWLGRNDMGHDSQGRPFNSFTGALDDVRLYDRALTEEEVLVLFEDRR